MYAVIFFDKLEYQRRPVFWNRDKGEIQVWHDKNDAQKEADTRYHAVVVLANTLPYNWHVTPTECRQCGSKQLYADGLCNACFSR